MSKRHVQWLYRELPNWVSNAVITEDVAERLRQHPVSVFHRRDGVAGCASFSYPPGTSLWYWGLLALLLPFLVQLWRRQRINGARR